MSNFVNLLDIIYPVSSIYITASGVSPATSIGGTWTQIKDGACLAAYDNIVGYTGSKTISVKQMPVHAHAQYVTVNYGNPNIVRKDYSADAGSAGAQIILKGVILVTLVVGKIIILIHMLAKCGYELLKA